MPDSPSHIDFAHFAAHGTTFYPGALAQVAPPAGGGPAPAAPPPGGGGGSSQPAPSGLAALGQMLPIALMLVAFYFFMIRPQQAKQRELDKKLAKGTRVVTNGGAIGKVVDTTPHRVTLEIAPGVKVQYLRSAISGIDEGEPTTAAADKPSEVRKP